MKSGKRNLYNRIKNKDRYSGKIIPAREKNVHRSSKEKNEGVINSRPLSRVSKRTSTSNHQAKQLKLKIFQS